jgi:hypothetical protein
VSASEALRVARAAGIDLSIDENDLVLEAASEAPYAVLDMLRQHKGDIIKLLQSERLGGDSLSAADWQGFFEGRAEIAERHGGLSRAEAEAQAFACCFAEWLNRNPMRSPPGRCFGCGGYGYEGSHNPLLPFGIGNAGEVWLHSGCCSAWYAGRKAEAIAALAGMGVVAPANFADDFGKNGK